MPGFARGSGRDLLYVKELTPGTTPGTPAMTQLRNTGDSLILSKDSTTSGELRADRALTDVITGNKQTGGGIDFEWSYDNFDDFIAGALFADIVVDVPTDILTGITNGVTPHSFTIEKGFPGVPFFQQFTGMQVNTFNINLQGNSPVTGSLDLIGTGYTSGAATIADSVIDPTQGGIFNSYNGNLSEGGIANQGIVLSMTMSINNNITPAFALFDDTAKELVDGRCIVEGSLQVYFENATIYDKFANDTESSLEFTLTTLAGSYTVELPRVRYTSADNPVSEEGPVNVTMNFQALQDDTAGYTIKVTKA